MSWLHSVVKSNYNVYFNITGEFSKADIARAWFDQEASNIVQTALAYSHLFSLDHVYLLGSFVDDPLVQQLITHQFVRQNLDAYALHEWVIVSNI